MRPLPAIKSMCAGYQNAHQPEPEGTPDAPHHASQAVLPSTVAPMSPSLRPREVRAPTQPYHEGAVNRLVFVSLSRDAMPTACKGSISKDEENTQTRNLLKVAS